MPTTDFIPSGEDTGAYEGGSYSDFVPAKVPVKKPVEEVKKEKKETK